MSGIKQQQILQTLTKVKDLRKSLAETAYLRCSRQQKLLHTERQIHAGHLQKCRTATPIRRNAVLQRLAGTPVDQQTIHTAHETLRDMSRQLAAMEQKQQTLDDDCRQAADTTTAARARLAAAIRQMEKFSSAAIHRWYKPAATDNHEDMELEDRPHPHFYRMASDSGNEISHPGPPYIKELP